MVYPCHLHRAPDPDALAVMSKWHRQKDIGERDGCIHLLRGSFGAPVDRSARQVSAERVGVSIHDQLSLAPPC